MSSNYQSVSLSTGEAASDISVEEHGGNGISVRATGGTTVVNDDGSTTTKGYSSTESLEKVAPQFLNEYGNACNAPVARGSVIITQPDGKTMTVSTTVAERLGFLSKDAGGMDQVNRSAVANAANGEAPTPQAADSIHDFGLSPRELASVDESLSGLDDHALASISASAIGSLATTGDLSKAVARYSEATGLDPEIAQAKVLQAAQPFYEAGGRYLSQVVGLPESDHSQFLEYCQQNEPQALREAFEDITKKNNYRSLGKMVRGFMNNTTPSLEALDNHGIPHREVNGRTQVQLKGTWMDLKAARKAEMI